MSPNVTTSVSIPTTCTEGAIHLRPATIVTAATRRSPERREQTLIVNVATPAVGGGFEWTEAGWAPTEEVALRIAGMYLTLQARSKRIPAPSFATSIADGFAALDAARA